MRIRCHLCQMPVVRQPGRELKTVEGGKPVHTVCWHMCRKAYEQFEVTEANV